MNLRCVFSRKILASIFIVSALLLPTHLLATNSSAASPPVTGLVIPLYQYPDSAYHTVAQMAERYPGVPMIAILNPGNGPGYSFSSTYASAIKELTSAGVKVLGYVPTEYASKPITSVKHMINEYLWWYPKIKGIDFDEMNNHLLYLSYYLALNTYVKSHGYSLTYGNPGTGIPSSFMGSMNVFCIHESYTRLSLSSIQSRTMGYGRWNFAYIQYATSLPSYSYISGVAKHVKWIYFTDGKLPNPYSTLPTYFGRLVADVNSINGHATITVKSVNYNGVAFSGMHVLVYSSGGEILKEGFSTYSFSASVGTSYKICVQNYEYYVFQHWADGSTNHCKVFSPSQSATLSAVYKT